MNKLLKSEEFSKLDKYYKTKTVLDIFGIPRWELSYSSFIAWLLDPKESHGLKEYAIRKFIELCKNDDKFNEELREIIDKKYKINNVHIKKEKAVPSGRLDIFIEVDIEVEKVNKKIYIIIENKVCSSERSNNGEYQTDKYQFWLDKEYVKKENNNIPLLVFLAPSKDNKKSTDNKFCFLSYQDFNDKLLCNCLDKISDEYYKNVISDFLCCLSHPMELTEDSKPTSKYGIAVSSYERNIIKTIMEKYKNELTQILNEKLGNSKDKVYDLNEVVFSGIFNFWYNELKKENENKSLEKSQRDIMKSIKDVLNYKTQIKFNNEIYVKSANEKSLSRLIHDMIENYVKNEKDVTYEKLDEKLNKRTWKYDRNKIYSVALKEDFDKLKKEDRERFFSKEEEVITLNNDEKIYVFRFWDEEDTQLIADLLGQEIEKL